MGDALSVNPTVIARNSSGISHSDCQGVLVQEADTFRTSIYLPNLATAPGFDNEPLSKGLACHPRMCLQSSVKRLEGYGCDKEIAGQHVANKQRKQDNIASIFGVPPPEQKAHEGLSWKAVSCAKRTPCPCKFIHSAFGW